jgi:DNA-binding PadR family transcriptional regulator
VLPPTGATNGIAQRIRQISHAIVQLKQGSLYPAFHRLEKRGWLKADWRPLETGREAEFYSLTRLDRQLEPLGRRRRADYNETFGTVARIGNRVSH